MSEVVTVALPVRDGARDLETTLGAVRRQRLPPGTELELLVCDSGSRDGSTAIARRHDARVITIAPEQFSHGATRNLLVERSHGRHIAFLTQDAAPAAEDWLAQLLAGFDLAPDVGLVFGPYRPRPDASPMIARELLQWFESFAPDGRPRIDRLGPGERGLCARALLGPRGFFTDANGCLSRAAWERAPFRSVPYAEDHVLAHDVLRAGFAKVFLPDAAVIHSHDYTAIGWLQRSFDEARALAAVYGFVEPLGWRRTPLKVWGLVGADWRWARQQADASAAEDRRSRIRGAFGIGLLASSLGLHLARTAGAALGGRAGHLPSSAVRRLSLERRVQ